MASESPEKQEVVLLVVALALVAAALFVAYTASNSYAPPILTMWILGAAALGLVSGFMTGSSSSVEANQQLIGFLSAGVIVPLLGGIAAVLNTPEKTTETMTYTGEHVTNKITEVVNNPEVIELYPLWVVGSFFLAFGLSSIAGVALGVRRRNGTVKGKTAAIMVGDSLPPPR